MLENKVKLVVWDMDDTFWNGTLAEGEIAPIESNVELAKTLTARGMRAGEFLCKQLVGRPVQTAGPRSPS